MMFGGACLLSAVLTAVRTMATCPSWMPYHATTIFQASSGNNSNDSSPEPGLRRTKFFPVESLRTSSIMSELSTGPREASSEATLDALESARRSRAFSTHVRDTKYAVLPSWTGASANAFKRVSIILICS